MPIMPMFKASKRVKTTPCQTKTYGEKNVSVKVPWFRPLAIDD